MGKQNFFQSHELVTFFREICCLDINLNLWHWKGKMISYFPKRYLDFYWHTYLKIFNHFLIGFSGHLSFLKPLW